MSELFSSLFTKEQPWANRSRCSFKKKDCEPIVLVALKKRATSVIHLWFKQIAFKKWAICTRLYFSYVSWQFFSAFPLFMPKSESLLSLFAQPLFFKEQQECFALIALYKGVTISNLLPSIITNERPWVISYFSWENRSIAHKKQAIGLKNWRAKFQPWPKPESPKIWTPKAEVYKNLETQFQSHQKLIHTKQELPKGRTPKARVAKNVGHLKPESPSISTPKARVTKN